MSHINYRLFHESLLRKRRKKNKKEKNKRRFNYLQKKRIGKLEPRIKKNSHDYYLKNRSHFNKKPRYSERIKYFLSKKDAFGNKKLNNNSNTFVVPNIFSLCENYKESCNFLRMFFNSLFYQSHKNIYIDYGSCSQIDVDASLCMDIILADFIEYFENNLDAGKLLKVDTIIPVNFENPNIKKVLFSIGAFTNIRGFEISFDNVKPFKMRVGDTRKSEHPKRREVHITQVIDYIIECLNKMNRTLTLEAESNLYKAVGEMIINAEEHSSTSNRYLIGYFEDILDEDQHYGVFNLSILNWGDSIYETFKSPLCKNTLVKKQMQDLSEKYTQSNFFKTAEFEEESLWTLYSLQDGVTRKADWKRGGGCIRFIEGFFNLKGNDNYDNVSKMSIISGNTRIIFDGTYGIVLKERGIQKEKFKMMTFNESGNIEDRPDSRYVNYTENYFPGTLITAKIFIDEENTELIA